MFCPSCKIELNKTIFNEVEIDYCPKCLGIWFDKDKLRQAKDEKDRDLNWVDIDLWQDEKKFKVSQSRKVCPSCSVPLYEVKYGDSKISVDVCNLCEGIWLDRGEFKEIVDYLRRKGKYEIVNNYFKNLAKEGMEIFTGPESFKSEIGDFLTIWKLLKYKIEGRYSIISKLISTFPK